MSASFDNEKITPLKEKLALTLLEIASPISVPGTLLLGE